MSISLPFSGNFPLSASCRRRRIGIERPDLKRRGVSAKALCSRSSCEVEVDGGSSSFLHDSYSGENSMKNKFYVMTGILALVIAVPSARAQVVYRLDNG